MKKISLAAAFAAASLLSSGAMAQAYVNAAIGASHYKADCEGLSCDKSDTGAKIALGYEFVPNIAGEVGYMSFGRMKATDGVDTLKVEAGGLFVGAAIRAQFSPVWNATVRAGVVSMKTKVSVAGVSDDDTKAKAYVGVALGYQLTSQLNLELGADFSRAEYSDADLKGDVRNLNVGLRYAF